MVDVTLIVREYGKVVQIARVVLSGRNTTGMTAAMLASLHGGGTEAARGTDAPIGEQIDAWITSLAPTVPKAQERERYRRELARLAAACSIATAAEATFDQVSRYLTDRRENNLNGGKPLRGKHRRAAPLRGKTYNAVLSKVRSFFAFAVRSRWIAEDPTAGIDWAQEQDSEDGSRPFTAQEVAAMLTRAGTPDPGDKRRTTDRYYVYLLATATPLRRSTLQRLEWPMFRTWSTNADQGGHPAGELRLPRRAVKKAKRVQTVPLPRWAVEALIEWWHACDCPREGPVFPRIPEHNTILADAAAVGIDRYTPEGGVGWNSFRKFYLTDMATRTMPAVLNELSGHQDIRTTLKFYVGQTRAQAAVAVSGIENPSNVEKFVGRAVSAQRAGRNASGPDVSKRETPPSPHRADLTSGAEPVQDVPSHPERPQVPAEPKNISNKGPADLRTREGEISAFNGGRAFSDQRSAENDPMGIRTPSGLPGGNRTPDYRVLAVELARGLRQVAGAVVQALELEEHDHAGDLPSHG